jgi:hypothetical protein
VTLKAGMKKNILACLGIALTSLLLAACTNPTARHSAAIEAAWKAQIHACITGDKAGFEKVLHAASQADTNKVSLTFAIVHGLARGTKITETDVRIDQIYFNPKFTEATVSTSYRVPSVNVWTQFTNPEIWVRENGRWLRKL